MIRARTPNTLLIPLISALSVLSLGTSACATTVNSKGPSDIALEREILYDNNYHSPMAIGSRVIVASKKFYPAHTEIRTSSCGGPNSCYSYVPVPSNYQITVSFCPISDEGSCIKDDFPVSEELYQKTEAGDMLVVTQQANDILSLSK